MTETDDSSEYQSNGSRGNGNEIEPDDESDRPSNKNGQAPDRGPSEVLGAKFCIGMFEAANRPDKILTIARDKTVKEAITMMMTHDYSQLPVTQNMRDIDGMISWRSMGQARARGATCEFVRECTESVPMLDQDAPFLEAVDIITEKEVVLVLGTDRKIVGIVTTADLGLEYHHKAAPFLLLGEIEDHIRVLINQSFSVDEIRQSRYPPDDNREIIDALDLNFGEYVMLLQAEENWKKLGWDIDRKLFVNLLNDVREVRNDVMHFRLDSSEPENLDRVRQLHNLLRQLVQ